MVASRLPSRRRVQRFGPFIQNGIWTVEESGLPVPITHSSPLAGSFPLPSIPIMAIPSPHAIPTLATDLFTLASRGYLGFCETICLRRNDKVHLNPASHRTFVRDTAPLQFEVALKTRSVAIPEVIRR